MSKQRISRGFQWISIIGLLFFSGLTYPEEYQSQDEFLGTTFGDAKVKVQMLWLNPEHKAAAKQILGHPYKSLRVRYWSSKTNHTAWILEEIGKERPIRIGVVIEKEKIKNVSILAFQESRGWEVRFPFFTDQFSGVAFSDMKNAGAENMTYKLDKRIDGITGATLSVRAVTNTAIFALYLQQQTQATQKEPM